VPNYQNIREKINKKFLLAKITNQGILRSCEFVQLMFLRVLVLISELMLAML